MPRNPDALTRADVAELLGISERSVARLRREGLLVVVHGGNRFYSRAEIEAFRADPWLNGVGAAEVLGVTHNRVSQLALGDKIPFRLTKSGKRVYKRSQIEVVANARQLRKKASPDDLLARRLKLR